MRVIKLIEFLKVKSRPVKSMARYLQIGERSVYRYLKMFEELGYKLNKDTNNKYKMREELENLVQDAVPSPTTEYRPSDKEALCEHEIRIRFLSRGCIIQVGCKEIAFESVETAMQELNEYVKHPYETQKKWRKLLD